MESGRSAMPEYDANDINIEQLEVIENLLNLIVEREDEIRELTEENDRLRSMVETLSSDGEVEEVDNESWSMPYGVLIADDSELMRKKLMELFINNGFKVVANAKNGNEAVELYQLHRPALVTMDIEMPKKDGYQATREIMKLDPGAKIVIISHVMDKTRILHAINCGAADFVIKPVQPQRLIELMRKLIA